MEMHVSPNETTLMSEDVPPTPAPLMGESRPAAAARAAARAVGPRLARPGLARARRAWRARRGLLAPDLLALTVALLVTMLVFSSPTRGVGHLALLVAFVPLTLGIGSAHGLYARDRERADHTTADDLVGIFQIVTLASWLVVTIAIVSGAQAGPPRAQVLNWATAILLMTAFRAAARVDRRRRETSLQNTVIVGAGEIGQVVADKLLRNPRFGCRLVGFVDANPRERPRTLMDVPVLGSVDHLSTVIRDLRVERVMIAFSEDSQLRTLGVLRSLSGHNVHVDIVPRLFEAVGPRASVHALEGLPLVGLPPRLAVPGRSRVKRVIDIIAAAVALILFSPVLLLIAVLVKLDSPGAVLYWGERIGANGSRFRVCKFRTMKSEHCRGERYGAAVAEARFAEMMSDSTLRVEFERTHKLRNDPRVTRVGARLRRSYLDELPQLWNVMRGDLSLVGPRPITAEEFAQLELEARVARQSSGDASGAREVPGYWELNSIRPGLTGYWQITGGSQVGYGERRRLDLLYAADWSLKLDLLIVAKTLAVLVRRGTC